MYLRISLGKRYSTSTFIPAQNHLNAMPDKYESNSPKEAHGAVATIATLVSKLEEAPALFTVTIHLESIIWNSNDQTHSRCSGGNPLKSPENTHSGSASTATSLVLLDCDRRIHSV
jgi:hypothetical protein